MVNSRLYRSVELHLDSPSLLPPCCATLDRDKFTFTFGVWHRVTRERKWIVGRRSWPLEHHVYFRSLCTCKCWDNSRNKTVRDLRKWRSRFQKKVTELWLVRTQRFRGTGRLDSNWHEEGHRSPPREGHREKYHCICRIIAVGWKFN